jgi:hypothetical protein
MTTSTRRWLRLLCSVEACGVSPEQKERTMTKQVSWVKASPQNVKVASLIKKIAQSDKAIETGGCGCGCGDDAPAASQRSE